MLRVYYTELPEYVLLDEKNIPLSSYRRERLRKVKAPAVRRQMLCAELLLIQAVREWSFEAVVPLEIQEGEKGKPGFVSLPLFFSLSHSGPFIACALSDHEVGIDIQKRSGYRESLAKRCFSDRERRYLEKCTDRDAVFTEIWCLKESYLKATGEGITRPMSDFSLAFDDPLTLADSDDVRFWQRMDARYHLAVCTLNGGVPDPDRIVKAELRP